jgi:predicted component of type VI protein secretion system
MSNLAFIWKLWLQPQKIHLFWTEITGYYCVTLVLKQKAARDSGMAPASAAIPPLMMGSPVVSGVTGASTPLTLAAAAVTAAQWLAVAQQQQQVAAAPNITLDSLIGQQNQLQEQIRQSEQNLAAQHTVQ